MRIVSVVGARPNFMKIAPFVRAIEAANDAAERADRHEGLATALGNGHPAPEPPAESPAEPAASRAPASTDAAEHILVHTGQHYDPRMSDAFFEDLAIPRPDVHMEIGSGSHAEQVGRTMMAFEKVLEQVEPDWVVVVGDVNATCACSITAKKMGIPVAHIEAGLRSFDMAMPEEINRLVTDRLADLLFTTDEIADQNLRNEGVSDDRIRRVGNIMIDTLLAHRERAAALDLESILTDAASDGTLDKAAMADVADGGAFAVLTLHRPSNVDDVATLAPLIDWFVDELSPRLPLIWPIHPRTRGRLESFGLWEKVQKAAGVLLVEPLGYHAMLKLNHRARVMLTDSGGLQEECCVLGTPCLTLRWNTERPVTLIEHGGLSELVGNDVQRIRTGFARAMDSEPRPHAPPLWDGRTAPRIAEILLGG